MSHAIEDAMSLIHSVSRAASSGTPLVTIQFKTPLDEARFYEFIRDRLPAEMFNSLTQSSLRETMGRANVQAVISGVPVRITSDARIDEVVRLNFK